MEPYLEKVRHAAYRVTDADINELLVPSSWDAPN
jgi:hypothetical protein